MIAGLAAAVERFPLISRRRIFVVYGIALIIGTHIPRFKLQGAGMIIPPDRILHLLAFGGLTMLIMGAHLINRQGALLSKRNIYGSAVSAFLWGSLTELTQQFLVPGRWANSWDVGCNITGITLAIIVCLILRRAQINAAN